MGAFRSTVALSLRDASYAAGAAWTLAQEDGISTVEVVGESVVLVGTVAEADAMHCWRVALLNERLIAQADEGRHAMLATLIA
jgi:hypothetical protein